MSHAVTLIRCRGEASEKVPVSADIVFSTLIVGKSIRDDATLPTISRGHVIVGFGRSGRFSSVPMIQAEVNDLPARVFDKDQHMQRGKRISDFAL